MSDVIYKTGERPHHSRTKVRLTDVIYKTGEQSEADPFEFILSTPNVDRHGDIVEQDWNLTNFRKNPIALWAHDSFTPIGMWKNVRVVDDVLKGRLQLAEKGTSRFIDFLRSMIEQRILRAVSVGFYSKKYEALDEDDPWGGLRLWDNELLEASVASVPANPNALNTAKAMLTAEQCQQVFSESREGVLKAGAALQLKLPKSRDSGIRTTSQLSAAGSPRRAVTMTLSERIQAKQKDISQNRDQLTELQNQIDSAEGDSIEEETLIQIEETSARIEKSQKELDVLLRAEKAMALRAEDTRSVTQDGSGAVAPNPRMATPIQTRVNRPKGHKQMAVFACLLSSHVQRVNPAEIARAAYRDEPEIEILTKAAANPADTTTPEWAGNLVTESYAEFVELLRDVSIYPQLPGTRAQFDRSGRIVAPQQQGRGNLAGGFIGELAPIPVKEGIVQSTDLTPKKMAVISTYSKELGRQSTPMIQSVISDQILGDTAESLDTAYLDNGARTVIRPAGLQDPTETGASHINPATGATVATINVDSKGMIARFLQSRSGSAAVWIMNPLRVLGLQTVQDAASGTFPFAAGIAAGTFQNYPFLSSQNVPEDVVYLQSAGAMTYGDAYAPILEVNDVAALILSDDPENDFPATVNMTSLFQVDGVGVKMTLGLDWRFTRGNGSVQVLTGVAW